MIRESLSFHAQTGIKVIYTFENEDGSPRDMTGKVVEFRLDNSFTKALTIDPLAPSQMTLVLLGSEVSTLVGKKAQYIVVDKSLTPPAEVASGALIVTGWL